jgi:hypothetical protein
MNALWDYKYMPGDFVEEVKKKERLEKTLYLWRNHIENIKNLDKHKK